MKFIESCPLFGSNKLLWKFKKLKFIKEKVNLSRKMHKGNLQSSAGGQDVLHS